MKMNILQSFMGCMYPGSIRTESIESMDYDNPERRFQVANVDETGQEVSSGEIQLTDNDLIYFRPGKVPIRWPISYIRRFGCSDNGKIFLFESGRKSPTGEAIYAFQLTHGANLVNKLKETIEKKSSRLNQPLPASSNHCGFLTDSLINRDPQVSNECPNYSDVEAVTGCVGYQNKTTTDLKPLPYSGINHDMTKSLNELALAHAASRKK